MYFQAVHMLVVPFLSPSYLFWAIVIFLSRTNSPPSVRFLFFLSILTWYTWLNYPSLLFSRDLCCRLKLVRVGAVTISLGRLFQSSTTLLAKKLCRNLVRQCCFSSFRVWPRSCLCEYVKKVDWSVLYISCVYLNTSHRSINLLLSSRLVSDSGGLVSFEHLFCTFSRLSISVLVCGFQAGLAYLIQCLYLALGQVSKTPLDNTYSLIGFFDYLCYVSVWFEGVCDCDPEFFFGVLPVPVCGRLGYMHNWIDFRFRCAGNTYFSELPKKSLSKRRSKVSSVKNHLKWLDLILWTKCRPSWKG